MSESQQLVITIDVRSFFDNKIDPNKYEEKVKNRLPDYEVTVRQKSSEPNDDANYDLVGGVVHWAVRVRFLQEQEKSRIQTILIETFNELAGQTKGDQTKGHPLSSCTPAPLPLSFTHDPPALHPRLTRRHCAGEKIA